MHGRKSTRRIGLHLSPLKRLGGSGSNTCDLFRVIKKSRRYRKRPCVTLSYAQSLDGCIALRRGKPLNLSGRQSLTFTHRLRAAHDAILVGIGTVLADNPRLTVRLVTGKNPLPIILDSKLRLPIDSNVLQDHPRSPLIATGKNAEEQRQRDLEQAGAHVSRLPINEKGLVNLTVLLEYLVERGIHNLMVEGGARVITSFLSNRLVDRLVLTVTPFLIGGLRAVGTPGEGDLNCFPRLSNVDFRRFGEDIVLWGEPVWEDQ